MKKVVISLFLLLLINNLAIAQNDSHSNDYEIVRQRILDAEASHTTHLFLNVLDTTELPPEIGNLTDLKNLSVLGHHLITLPAEIGNLVHLEELQITGDALSSLPSEIGNLTSLENLVISSNLSSLPPEVGNLGNLQSLILYYNELTTLPPEMGNLVNLRYLNLTENNLMSLPPEIGNLAGLEILFLAFNNLAELPAAIGELRSLRHLDISYNELVSLPSEIGHLYNLTVIDMSYNNLDNLPASMAFLTELCAFNLTNNQLVYIPSELARLDGLAESNCGLLLDDNPLIYPPEEIIEQGTVAILEYLATYGVDGSLIAPTPFPVICNDSPPSRLNMGDLAFVSISEEGEIREDLRIRSEPNGERSGAIPEGTLLRIVGGPVCANGLTWWEIETQDGLLHGWSAEGLAPDDYFIEPGP